MKINRVHYLQLWHLTSVGAAWSLFLENSLYQAEIEIAVWTNTYSCCTKTLLGIGDCTSYFASCLWIAQNIGQVLG